MMPTGFTNAASMMSTWANGYGSFSTVAMGSFSGGDNRIRRDPTEIFQSVELLTQLPGEAKLEIEVS